MTPKWHFPFRLKKHLVTTSSFGTIRFILGISFGGNLNVAATARGSFGTIGFILGISSGGNLNVAATARGGESGEWHVTWGFHKDKRVDGINRLSFKRQELS